MTITSIIFGFLGVGAAWRTADVEKGSTVVIFGLGSIGLAVRSCRTLYKYCFFSFLAFIFERLQRKAHACLFSRLQRELDFVELQKLLA